MSRRRALGEIGLTGIAAGAVLVGATESLAGPAGAATVNKGSQVTVFNVFVDSGSLRVDNSVAGEIKRWSGGQDTPRYTPSSIGVRRTKLREPGATFAIGDNEVRIVWPDFTGTCTVPIPNPASSGVNLADDLLLYLMLGRAILVTTRSDVLDTLTMKIDPTRR